MSDAWWVNEKGIQRLQLREGHFVVEKLEVCNQIKFAKISLV
jgi:hypothetical protein